MSEDLQRQFESIFAQVIDSNRKNVQLIQNPDSVYVPMAEGFRYEYAFHFAIKYFDGDTEYYLAFRFLEQEGLVPYKDCQAWVYATKCLPPTLRVCLVTDKGFEPHALDYVRSHSFDIDHRLILAKYCGNNEQSFVLNRLWADYLDPRGRLGVLVNEKPCAGVVLNMAHTSYNTIGILSELGIPIKKEYEFKCPYLTNEYIEECTIKILNATLQSESEMLEDPDYLWRIANNEKIQIELIDMGEEFFGEYSYSEKKIYLNKRARFNGPTERERFTLAHELGHHFLHGDILKQFNYIAADDQDSLNAAGSSNEHMRYFENQANKFASYLLMPGNAIVRYAKEVMQQLNINKGCVHDDGQYSLSEGAFNHIKAMQFISQVASHFYVSKEAARYRLKELGLLHEEHSIERPLMMI